MDAGQLVLFPQLFVACIALLPLNLVQLSVLVMELLSKVHSLPLCVLASHGCTQLGQIEHCLSLLPLTAGMQSMPSLHKQYST